MKDFMSARFAGAMGIGAVAAGVLLAGASSASAKHQRVASIGRIETPLGLQGTRGAGGNVGVIFNLIDPKRRKTDVEVQYGIDRNADGTISEDEYRPATEDRFDPRDTRKNNEPQLFSTSGDEIGAAHQYIWKTVADIATDRLLTLEFALTPQGRQVPDPDNPGSFLFATGPGNTPVLAGVQVRARAVRPSRNGVGSPAVGAWVVSDSFGVNNNNPPSATIDSVDDNGISVPPASDEAVLVHWTIFDPDSEDLNGNGVLDVADGEDANGNGQLDDERVGVAFDYHRVAAGEDPAVMTPEQLAALAWLPCTRKKGAGDTDSLLASPGVERPTSGDLAGLPSAPVGVGRSWTFAWSSMEDVGTVYAKFILRARPFDQKREIGSWAYRTTPIQIDNWRVFNPGSAGFPVAALTSGRVGQSVTNIRSSLDAGNVLDRGETNGLLGFQSVLVAGGATSLNGGGVTSLDVMSLNTLTAETTTSARIGLLLSGPRAFHSATALDDGRILFIGGFNATGTTPVATTEVYDPKTKTVTPGPVLATARARHAAVKLAGGDVAIFGGVGAGGIVLSSCELITVQPYANQADVPIVPGTSWTVTPLPSLATAQHTLRAVTLPDQTVLVAGGIDTAGAAVRTAQLLNPLHDDDTTSPTTKNPNFIALPLTQLAEGRRFGTVTVLIDGNVLFAGGASSPAKATMEIFNWKTRAFEAVNATMQVARAQHTAIRLGDGSVLLLGGTADPEAATPTAIADADVIQIGARDALSGTWAATSLQMNGDLTGGRRLAVAAAIPNGRVLIVGGADTTGTIATCETYTPANGTNAAPIARTSLPSSEQSYLFGAPVYYRLTDVEQDRARVEVQFIDRTTTGDRVWHACSPAASTIGGDVADFTADLGTALTDDLTVAIDPVVRNTPGDHAFIWAMSKDINRPMLGETKKGFNLRVIPYGAVVGTSSESDPIDVLYNTKILPKILPFENVSAGRPDVNLPAGALTPNQGGDVKIWVHLLDLDGGAPGTNGDPATCLFRYAVDANLDGQIKDTDGEFFQNMTPSGAAVGAPSSTNPQTGLATYYNAFTDSDPAFGARPASKGWTSFIWDSLRDIGAPATTFSNIFIEITPSDANEGFVRTLRNVTGQPPVLTIIRHPDSLYLLSWRPRYSNSKTAMPVNDPIDFTFNGQIEPASASDTSVQVFRGTGVATSQVRGALQVVNNAGLNQSVVTFFPDAQSLLNQVPVTAQNAASTVLFPNDDYSVRMPGYIPSTSPVALDGDPRLQPVATNPTNKAVTMLRPLGWTDGRTSSYRLVQLVPINAGPLLNDPAYKFRTAAVGVYADDLTPVTNTMQSQPSGSGILKGPAVSVSYTFSQAIDTNTVQSPNITATLAAPSGTTSGGGRVTQPVVAGKWSVVNTPTPGVPGASTSVLTFTPLIQLPSTKQVQIQWNAGLKGFNGRAPAPASFVYNVESYAATTKSNVTLEDFSTTAFNDSTVTTAVWGTDPCAGAALSGGGSGGIQPPVPTGTNGALTVASGATQTITFARQDYTTITVAKGGTLILDSQVGPMALTATGDITIHGTVRFSGQDGRHGVHGNSTVSMAYGGPTTAGTRVGGLGRNGGGSGGNSASAASTTWRNAGADGNNGQFTASTTTSLATGTKGGGGNSMTETSSSISARYLYGAGGGAGGGNATSGLAGGRATSASGFATAGGGPSTPGVAGGDAFFTSGVPGGGGGGGGATVGFSSTTLYIEGGAGGAGAGSVSFVCNGTFNLSATGLIEGRGGAGGQSAHGSGSGGAGAGGSLLVVAKQLAKFDGVVDLRGGIGGAKGFAGMDLYNGSNIASLKTVRYGGDGAPGRLVVLAPNYASAGEVRVYGQLMQRQIATLPTSAIGTNDGTRPIVMGGTTTNQQFSVGTTQEYHWSSLTINANAVCDLFSTNGSSSTPQQSTPLRIFVDGQVTINGTLRLNGDTAGLNSSGVGGQNFGFRTRYPSGYFNNWTTTYGSAPSLSEGRGMGGNLGGTNGGDGFTLGLNSGGREAGDAGAVPQLAGSTISPRGMHNALATSGAAVYPSWTTYTGDSGGTGGANATDGEDGWAEYATPVAYNYLGAAADTAGVGVISRSGKPVGQSLAPIRLGGTTTNNDPSLISISNLASFAGSGGGGGGAGGDTNYGSWTYAGLGGGGAGALGIVTPGNITIGSTGVIEAKGGEGETPGFATLYVNWIYMHAAGGGGSGGTVYLAANTVTIATVDPTTGAGGATFNMTGGLGGGRRSHQPSSSSISAYPEYLTAGSFGGSGGYGRLVIDYKTSINNGVPIANRWGLEQTTIDANTNTFNALAGTSRFFCPGIVAGGTRARSKWYDLKSVFPIVSSFAPAVVVFANPVTTQIEGAQSHPHNTLTSPTGDPDPTNTSIMGLPSGSPLLSGWRWFRFETNFVKTSTSSQGPVQIDDMKITYTTDLP